jgi:hypothetical protein
MPQPKCAQLKLSDADKERLKAQIRDDYQDDSADYENRNLAMKRWYRLWRNAMETNGFPNQEKCNFSIPLCLWIIKAILAKELDALLGEESEISVNPVGKSDVARVEKVKKWINWRSKQSLKLYTKLYDYLLQKRIFGTTIGYLPWVTKKRTVKKPVAVPQEPIPVQSTDQTTGLPTVVMQEQPQKIEIREVEVTEYDGPDLIVENLEDWIFPANAKNLDCDHFIRILKLTTDEMLDMAAEGKLDSKVLDDEDNWKQLRHLAETGHPDQNITGQEREITEEKKAQEGLPSVPQGREEEILVHNWIGKYRLGVTEKKPEGDRRTTEVVVFYQPDLSLILGACRLIDIFPDGRRPFIVSQATRDVNKIWGIGDCETLEPMNNEMDALHQLAMDAGAGSIGPVIFYEPSSGYRPDSHKIEPWTAVPTANANGVNVVNLGQIQLGPYVLLMNMLLSFAERVTAVTDPQLGRQSSQPNAPRTLGQQQILQGESNVNLLLGIRLERESMREMLQRIWEMDKRWLAKPVFFRVTEEDPGDTMTEEDMQGNYDFDIGPVTMVSNRAQRMQETMQLLTILLQMKLPQPLMLLVKKIAVKLGHPDVAKLMPDVEAMAPPEKPEDENVRLIQGETIHINPMDNHAAHIAIHEDLAARIEASTVQHPLTGQVVEVESVAPGSVGRLRAHIAEHQQAMKQGVLAGMNAMGAQNGKGSQIVPTFQPEQQGNVNAGAPPDLLANLRSQLGGLLNQGGPQG